MDERSWRGYWWLPDSPDDRVPGRLVVESNGDSRLELVGGLDLRLDEPQTRGSGRVSVLWGEAEGQPITLLDCFTSRRDGWGHRPQNFHDIYVHEVLVGAHIAKDEPAFQAAIVTIENLSSFLAMEQLIDRSETQDEHSVIARRAADITCEIDGWTVTARSLTQPFRVDAEHSRISISGEIGAYLVIRPSAPTSAEDFNGVVFELTDLITLAAGQASGRLGATLIHVDSIVSADRDGTRLERERRVESFGRRIHTADGAAPTPDDWRFLFTCKDIPFEEVVPRWFALRRKAPEACNVFFGMSFARPTYTEVRLLLAAITAESLHSSLYGDETEVPDEIFQSLRTRVLNSVTDLEERQWVRQRLRNAPSFRERLISLASRPDQMACSLVVDDVPKWARAVRKARDNLAHTGNENTNEDIFALEWVTNSLITLVLMAETGLSAETQQRAAHNILMLPENRRKRADLASNAQPAVQADN